MTRSNRHGFCFVCAIIAVVVPFRGCTTPQPALTLPGPELRVSATVEDTPVPQPLATHEIVMPEPPDMREAPITGPAKALRLDIIPRARWTTTRPRPVALYAMGVGRAITVHHDAVPLTATDSSSSRQRLQSIRRDHVQANGWADIGYHFAVDRAGRIWEARPLLYQGAHVRQHNPGNIGIVLMGDFESQAPTFAQIASLEALIKALRSQFDIPLSAVATHREWPGAATTCPGQQLQTIMNAARVGGRFGR